MTLSDSDFLAVLEAHKGVLYQLAHAYCARPEDRGDLIQDMIVELWRAWPKFDARRARASTWMYRIAINVAISAHRSDGRRVRDAVPIDAVAMDLAAADAELAAGDDDLHALQQLLARFDAVSRAIVLLYLDGHGHDEIAEFTGLTATNVSTRLHRIKQQLGRESAAGAQA